MAYIMYFINEEKMDPHIYAVSVHVSWSRSCQNITNMYTIKQTSWHLHVSCYEKIKKGWCGPHIHYIVWECTRNISRAWAMHHAFRSNICRCMTTTSGVIPVPASGHELRTSTCCGKQKTRATEDTYIKMWLRSSKPVSREIWGMLNVCIKETVLNFRLYSFKPGYK